MSSKSIKKRNWAFVLYPESAPLNWRDMLQQTGLQIAISPLHNKDLDPTGVPKKAHYHIILCYAGPTSFNVVRSLCDSLNQPIPIPLEQVKGYYRYLTHMDNPDKYQYDSKDIDTINGFEIGNYCELTRSEVNSIKLRIREIIIKADILEYSDLIDLLADSDMRDEWDIAVNNTLFFDRYISSRRNKRFSKSDDNN